MVLAFDGTTTMTNSNPYDEVHYPSRPFANTHPDRLHTIGKLYGMHPAPAGNCRVLELGCGAGGNLVPMAAYCPDCTFVGYDLSGDAIKEASARVDELKLGNITLHQGDICSIPSEIGPFDYIICHGVYSWVPPRVRQAIFEVIREHLAPQGLAFVSYNTLPGWHLRNAARTIFRCHGEQFDDPIERVKQGRALLNFIGDSYQDEEGLWGRVMGYGVHITEPSNDEYLYHDFFAPVNEPVLFRDFLRRARVFDLDYVGDAEFGKMKTLTLLPEPLKEMLDRLGSDVERNEQYLDLFWGTSFRRSLLCRRGVLLNREFSGEELEGFNVRMVGACEEGSVDLARAAPVHFMSKEDQLVIVESPLSQAALFIVADARPRALPFGEVVRRAHQLVDEPMTPASHRKLGQMLLMSFSAGLVDLHTRHIPCANALSPKPHTHDFVRLDCRTDVEYVTNPYHEIVGMDGFTREMLRLADGTRSHEQLADDLVVAVQEGRLTVRIDDQVCTDWDLIRESVKVLVATKLDTLTRAALFRHQFDG